ncbi:MAG: DUF523 domain-containing protein [Oscillospiraceae bacterium]|nr:DUF523 domain-containing protein [Oscillospiraceae bacterium]
MNLLISACLLGCACRYDGNSRPRPEIAALQPRFHLIPVCPEQMGGLPTPRPASERRGNRVVTALGTDVTDQYRRGAEEALRLAQLFHCSCALLKERSPSCGCGAIYDGTFSGTLIPGDGVTAALLKAHGIQVFGESQIRELLAQFSDSV